jgi:hypothetical protein
LNSAKQVIRARQLIDEAERGFREILGAAHPYTQYAIRVRSEVAAAMGGRVKRR